MSEDSSEIFHNDFDHTDKWDSCEMECQFLTFYRLFVELRIMNYELLILHNWTWGTS